MTWSVLYQQLAHSVCTDNWQRKKCWLCYTAGGVFIYFALVLCVHLSPPRKVSFTANQSKSKIHLTNHPYDETFLSWWVWPLPGWPRPHVRPTEWFDKNKNDNTTQPNTTERRFWGSMLDTVIITTPFKGRSFGSTLFITSVQLRRIGAEEQWKFSGGSKPD